MVLVSIGRTVIVQEIPEMVIVDVRCHHCGRGNSYPVLPQYSDPRFVEKLKYDYDRFKKEVRLMQADVKELAEECLRAGVVPERMRRLDSMLADLKAIIEWAKENDRATGAD